MNVSNKRKNPFEVLGLQEGEMSVSKIEHAYKNLRKELDENEGNEINFTYEDLEKAFQELIGYTDELSGQDTEEVVISATFLPSLKKKQENNSLNNQSNIIYIYKENQQIESPSEIQESYISRPIDSLMKMKNPTRKAKAASCKNPELIKSLEKLIASADNISGSFLRKLREKMFVSIEEMSNKIKVSKIYLESIENDSFENLPAEVYVRGFFNSYLNYIGLDRKDLVEALTEVYRAKKRLMK